jgi:hypothetical protein
MMGEGIGAMDTKDVQHIQVATGPLDQSEIHRIRERLLNRNSDIDGMQAQINENKAKLNRIWWIATLLGILGWAWMDGRFGFTTPNAVPITSEVEETIETTILTLNNEQPWDTND